MYLLVTGKQPFNRDDKIEVSFNLLEKFSDYAESATFALMIDFITKLLVLDPAKRMSP